MWLVLTEQQERIKGLEERQIALTEWVHSADTRVTDVEREATGSQQSISVLLERTDDIPAVRNDVATERERVNVLVDRVDGMAPIARDVVVLRGRVNAIDTRIDDVAQWQDAVEVSLNSVQPRDTANYEWRIDAIERRTADFVRWQNEVAAWSESVAQWQSGVNEYLASGQPQGTANNDMIVLDLVRAVYGGDLIAAARLAQYALTLLN